MSDTTTQPGTYGTPGTGSDPFAGRTCRPDRVQRGVLLLAAATFAGVLLVTPLGCQTQQAAVAPAVTTVDHHMMNEPPTVRVLLADRLNGAEVPSVQSASRVTFDKPGGGVIRELPRLAGSKIAVDGAGLRVGSLVFTEPTVMLRTPGAGTFTVGTRTYRGDLEIRRRADGTITLVNYLDLESYTRGVVAGEMPKEWPLEALKTQAVAARTYAYALVEEGKKSDGIFDVTADFQTTQVYEGVLGETPITDQAVRETRGVVLAYNGKPFRTYFCSTCGGHTEACGRVWNDYPTIAPLAGVECPYCTESKYYAPWQTTFSGAEVQRALQASGRNVPQVTGIKLADRNGDGHMDRVEVATGTGTVEMSGNEFRLAMGSTKLKSMMCRVERKGDPFMFSGRGFGHGVGMCQFGTLGMVKQGKVWEEVVHHYYPASDIWKIY